MSVGRANTGTFLAVKDVLLWERDARAGCCHRSKPRDEYAQVVISGLQVKALSGVGQNVLLSTIGNVSLWEQNAQAGCCGFKSRLPLFSPSDGALFFPLYPGEVRVSELPPCTRCAALPRSISSLISRSNGRHTRRARHRKMRNRSVSRHCGN